MTDAGPLIDVVKRGTESPSDEMAGPVEDASGNVAAIGNAGVNGSVRDVGGTETVSGVREELHATWGGTSDAGSVESVDGWISVESGDAWTAQVALGGPEG